jgi:hypothetical protein
MARSLPSPPESLPRNSSPGIPPRNPEQRLRHELCSASSTSLRRESRRLPQRRHPPASRYCYLPSGSVTPPFAIRLGGFLAYPWDGAVGLPKHVTRQWNPSRYRRPFGEFIRITKQRSEIHHRQRQLTPDSSPGSACHSRLVEELSLSQRITSLLEVANRDRLVASQSPLDEPKHFVPPFLCRGRMDRGLSIDWQAW